MSRSSRRCAARPPPTPGSPPSGRSTTSAATRDSARLIATFAGDLRPGLTVERATDMFWAFVSPAMMSMFCHQRGWTGEQYADWLVDAVKRQLLA